MRDYLALGKPRIALMVMATAALGGWLAGGAGTTLWLTAAGTGLAAMACGALNQWLESEQDALMARTRRRPLPAGRLSGAQAVAFGLFCSAAGLGLLLRASNGLACGLTALTLALYLLVYTPLKKITPQSTWFGAVAGAMPPLIGYAAVRGELGAAAWALFAIQFLWQIPHFLALFWLYRDDYARAGFRVMPVVDPRGRLTAAQIALHSFTVVPASLLPVFAGRAGPLYGAGALLLGSAYLGLGLRASWTLGAPDARRLFLASLAYLPILFSMLLLGT